MSRSKESVSLPTIGKSSSTLGKARTQKYIKAQAKPALALPSVQELVTRQALKKVSLWFRAWRVWQQRVFVCRVMQHCSGRQLHFLATALEPVLHIDFSSSLVPHLASLHVDGAATFQMQRGMLQRVFSSELLDPENSAAHLPSLPTTLLTSESASSKNCGGAVTGNETGNGDPSRSRLVVRSTGKKGGDRGNVLAPALPLTHSQHVPISPHSSLEDMLALRHTRFSSVPDFRSTRDLLRCVKHKELFRPRQHKRSQSLATYLHTKTNSQSQQEAEQFKAQLTAVSQWMMEWPAKQQSQLLLEAVKLCGNDLLAYFVQCLYQRLHDQIGMDCLPDSVLLNIFSYLDPKTLCRCAQVCWRWRHVSDTGSLWEHQCRELGRVEGVGDLVTAVRSVCEQQGGGTVDWKQAYRELSNVIWRIKKLVLKAAVETEEAQRVIEERRAASRLTKVALRAGLSLREMIELVRCRSDTPFSSVQEVLHSAPESAALVRRRNRIARKESEEERLSEETERALSSRYQHRRPYDRTAPHSRLEGIIVEEDESQQSVHHPRKTPEPDIVIELIHEAVDHRPGIHYLPDPDGIRCLVLAGCLMADQPHRPGRIQPIPRLRRIPPLYSTVLCLQCDHKKIVCGMQSRDIQVYDMRSGRHVNTLKGHKGSVQCLQFDDNKVVSGSWDTTCIVWNMVHGLLICELAGHTGCVSCLQFDEQRLVTGSHDKSIRVWSTSSWECTAVIGHAHQGPVSCLKFNTSIIASGAADKCVKLWCLATCKPLTTLHHPDRLTSLLLSNLLLVSACQSGSIQLWSMEPYHGSSATSCISRPLRTVSSGEGVSASLAPVTQWHLESEAYLTDMVLEGDKIFASASDCCIYEWDIATGTFTRYLSGHSRPVTCVGVTQRKLVSASEDHTVCVWYYKKTRTMSKDEAAELLMEECDPTFPDIPIRVITA